MTPEIKQRIDQIHNGEISKEYKHSKFGIIPKDWEILQLRDKFDRLSRKNAEGNTNVLTISAQYGLINQEEFFKKEIASDDKSNYYLLHRGEFAYNKSYSNGYPFGAIKRLSRYDKGVVSPLYICFSANSKNACPEYYEQYFEAGKMNREIQAIAQEGARNHGLLNISVSDFFNSFILVPLVAEQKRIAKILSAQDKVIECYEKKIEQLKQMKRYYLQNMFPKHGETVPKIRFKGFTDPWTRRKFSDFSWISGKRNKEALDLEPYAITNEYGFVRQSEAHDEFAYMKNTDRSAYIIVSPKSFAYNPARINVGSIGYYTGSDNIIVSSLYEVFQTADYVDDRFLWHWFKSDDFSRWVARLQEGSVRLYFYYDKLCECNIFMPSTNEQRVIAEFFDGFDNLITLHQRKLEEEKQKKKSLTQLLLSGIVRV